MKLFSLLKTFSSKSKNETREIKGKDSEEKYYSIKFNDRDMNLQASLITNFSTKFNSLYRQQRINPEEAFIFRNSRGFSSIGFRFAIDIVICDKSGEVLATYTNFAPQKLSSFYQKSYYVICFAKGTIKFWNIKANDIIKIQKSNTYWA